MQDEYRHKKGHILAGRYEILSEIGRGGFGMVYRARQINMNREVAIKILPPKFMAIPDVVERFKREAQLASRLKHPNTITIHDYGQDQGLLFIVMELLRGEDLADVLKRTPRLPTERIMHIGRQILKSLSEAHKHNIVHRDLKPENIFLENMDGETDFVKVLDFGIAKLAMPDTSTSGNRRLTVTGSTVGTPVYMSPEQAAGEEVNHQTDLYALGVIMYEMACGRPPFSDENPVKVMRSHLFNPVPPFDQDTGLSGTKLEHVIMKALQKETAARYQNAMEFLAQLDASKPEIAVMPTGLFQVNFDEGLDEDTLDNEEDPQEATSQPIDLNLFSDTAQFDKVNRPVDTEDIVPLSPSQITSSPSHVTPRQAASQKEAVREGLKPDLSTLKNLAKSHLEDSFAPPTGSSRLPTLDLEDNHLTNASSILQVIGEMPQEDVVVLTQPKGSKPIESQLELGSGGQAPLNMKPVHVEPERHAPEEAIVLPAPSPTEPPAPEPTLPPAPRRQVSPGMFASRQWTWGDEQEMQEHATESSEFVKSRRVWPVMLLAVVLFLSILGALYWFDYLKL